MKVCHFTSAHAANDDRIYLKECQALREEGHEVYIVARGESRELSGIQIVGCEPPKGRFSRLLFFSRKIYKTAKKQANGVITPIITPYCPLIYFPG